MKQQTRPPVLPPQKTPARPKSKGPASRQSPNARAGRKTLPVTPVEEPKVSMTLQQKMLAGLGLVVVAALFIILALQPQVKPDRLDQNNALGTALAATGITPPPTLIPGSDFGVDLVVYGIKDYIPVIPNEK